MNSQSLYCDHVHYYQRGQKQSMPRTFGISLTRFRIDSNIINIRIYHTQIIISDQDKHSELHGKKKMKHNLMYPVFSFYMRLFLYCILVYLVRKQKLLCAIGVHRSCDIHITTVIKRRDVQNPIIIIFNYFRTSINDPEQLKIIIHYVHVYIERNSIRIVID